MKAARLLILVLLSVGDAFQQGCIGRFTSSTIGSGGTRMRNPDRLRRSLTEFSGETTFMEHFNSLSPFLLSDEAVSTISAPPEAGGVSYSRASYYTILGLYAISFPGLWSTIKRSTSAKMKRKTYTSPGASVSSGRSLRDEAGEIMACKFVRSYCIRLLNPPTNILFSLCLCFYLRYESK